MRTALFLFKQFGKLIAPTLKTTSEHGNTIKSRRLVIFDPLTKLKFLIDSGADVSVIPKRFANNSLSESISLYAANGSKIKTFGTKLLN